MKPPRGYSWKLLTLSLRQHGDVFERVNGTIKMRADLARKLRDEYDMLAGFGAIEEGEHEGENVHLHFLALCKYAHYRLLKHWLQSRDCTVRHCHHPADDRCADCKRSRCDCHHPEVMPDGRLRTRCNGSWYVDVRRCYSRKGDGKLAYGSGADAAAEVVKYACKPTMHGNPHDASPDELRDEIAHARRVVLFYLAMRGRHRVETYGEAKHRAPGEEDAPDDAEPTASGPRCSECGGPMVCVGVGVRDRQHGGTFYDWGAQPSGP
jgi:hypothetical protein